MKKTMLEVIEGRNSYHLAFKSFSVPQSTLENRIKKYSKNKNLEIASKKGIGHFKTIFTIHQENVIYQHIIEDWSYITEVSDILMVLVKILQRD